jgi:hypothetical protein
MTGSESLFIPLDEAVATVHKEATGRATMDSSLFPALASSIARHFAIYAREGWGPTIERVRPDVLQHAVFQVDGVFMRSKNVTYSDLCMRRTDLPAATELLITAQKKNGT